MDAPFGLQNKYELGHLPLDLAVVKSIRVGKKIAPLPDHKCTLSGAVNSGSNRCREPLVSDEPSPPYLAPNGPKGPNTRVPGVFSCRLERHSRL